MIEPVSSPGPDPYEHFRIDSTGRLHWPLGRDALLSRLNPARHHLGTTRVHTDRAQGVVDEHCRVHGVANLHIVGSSVFPTPGIVNPTLTIIALAVRLATVFARHCEGPDDAHAIAP